MPDSVLACEKDWTNEVNEAVVCRRRSIKISIVMFGEGACRETLNLRAGCCEARTSWVRPLTEAWYGQPRRRGVILSVLDL
jgi:hypothetical protein